MACNPDSIPSPSSEDSSDPDPLRLLARHAARLASVPLCLVWEVDDGEGRFRTHAGDAHFGAIDQPPPLGKPCSEVIETGNRLVLPNARDDLRYRRELSAAGIEIGGYVGVPLVGSGGAVLGALCGIDHEPRSWTAEELESFTEVASLASGQIELERAAREPRRLAKALEHLEARYARLNDTASCGVCSVGLDGRVFELNEAGAEILGRATQDVLGVCFETLVLEEDQARARAEFVTRSHAPDGAQGELEVRVVRPSGERRILVVRTASIIEEGAVVGVHAAVRDVTEDRTREAQLRQAERMASVAPLLTGVCHELNNPLTSIKSFAELMLLDERPEEDREALEIVRREAERAAQIVGDLRVVARQSQDGTSARSLVDLNQVVNRSLELRRDSLAGAEVVVQRELGAAVPPAWAVANQLEQVLLQLLRNAQQAMVASPIRLLQIRTYACQLGAALQLQDSGVGIPPEHLERIFDPFFTTREAGEGTGLGLSLVHGIVTDHGGRVRVESRPGEGAIFTIEFPAAAAASPPPAGEIRTAATRPLRILIVDDEAPIRYSFMRYMQRRGHHVEEAQEGGEAIRRLEADGEERTFDVILADLRMPGLDGEQLLEYLCARGDGLERRVIFITGDAAGAAAERARKLAVGAPVVLKPFELAEIAQIIEAQATE